MAALFFASASGTLAQVPSDISKGTGVGIPLAMADPAVVEAGKSTSAQSAESKGAKAKATEPAGGSWQTLFDGKTLKGWKPSDFAGAGEVHVEKGQIMLDMGNDMTGITLTNTNSLPRINYEIDLDAMRVDGSDFFCGLTFPVREDPCSLIVGGWGGGVVGLSSLEGNDASSNETTSYMSFDTGRWYHIRLRVTDAKIEAWIDKKQVVNIPTAEHKFSIRIEVEESKPLGVTTWRTKGALKDIKLLRLDPAQPSNVRLIGK